MIRTTLVSFALSSSLLLAQEATEAAAVDQTPLATIRATNLPRLLEQLAGTRLGRLCADEDGAAALDGALRFLRRQSASRTLLLQEAIRCGVELEPWMMNNLFATPDMTRVLQHPFDEIADVRFSMDMAAADGRFPTPDMSFVVRCGPRHEGRWTQAFDQEAKVLAGSPWFTQDQQAKVDGYPAYRFTAAGSEQDDTPEPYYQVPKDVWMLHVPGTFAYSTGKAPTAAQLERPAQDEPAVVEVYLDLVRYVEMFAQGFGGAMPAEFTALGFHKLKHFTWSGRVVGELLLDEFAVELTDDAPTGFVGMLLGGEAALPAQPLPTGALFQLRAALDLGAAAEVLPAIDVPAPTELLEKLEQVLTGGVAVGVCAPQPGGLIPRLFVSLGLADEAAFGELVAGLLEQSGMPTKAATYEGVACTTLEIPGAPQGVQPTWCVVDGVLHVAESGRSLRAFLKARAAGGDAMDVGDAPLPEGPGERLATLDMRLDEAALYRAYYDIWLPLWELTNQQPVALERDDMPHPDVFAEFTGASRGALFRDGNRYTLRHLGALGGPEAAAIAMTYGPILTAGMRDYATEQLEATIAAHKARRVYEAVEAFEKREKRLPKDLAELFQAQRLDADALLVPGTTADEVTLDDGTVVRSSFRYFAETTMVESFNESFDALLIAIDPKTYGRAIVAKDGSTPTVYGDASLRSIDDFGK